MFLKDGSLKGAERTSSEEKVGFLGNVGLARGQKEPLGGEIVGSPRRVVSLDELMEPPSRNKVVSPEG